MALVETNCWHIVSEGKSSRLNQHGWGPECYRVPEVADDRAGSSLKNTWGLLILNIITIMRIDNNSDDDI